MLHEPGIILLFFLSFVTRLSANRTLVAVFQMCDVGKFRGHAYLPRINKVERSGEICFCTAGSSAMLVSLHHGRVAQLPSMFCSSAPGFIRAGVLQMSLSGGTSVME
uniref:Secreted protein n=1 Tax=Setaria viridis TaxID=4556 RepID=A0A4U6WM49_SETVI|nr:hypothetical protein SEVIR_1G185550v2 [Setaria viridis]